MTTKVSSSAINSMAAVIRGDREINPAYAEALESIKRIERHEENEGQLGPDCFPRVYSVTTIAGAAAYGGTRTVAICGSFDRACEMIERNEGDLFECSYEFAVIEEIYLNGLYGGSFDRAQYWYAWQGEAQGGRYVPISKPEQFADLGEFAVG